MSTGGHPLWHAGELELACMRSSAGQTTEARTAGGSAVAAGDGSGTITDAAGAVVAHAKASFPKGSSGRLDITDASGAALGSAELASFRFGPKALKGTLVVSDASGREVGRFEARDGKGHDVAISGPGGAQIGSLRQTGHDRGLRRSTTTYRLLLDDAGEEPARALLVVTAMRHQALLVAAKNMRAND